MHDESCYDWGFWGPQIKVGDEFKQDMQNGVPYNLTDGNAHIVQFGVWGTYPTNITLTLGDVTMSTADGGTVQYTVPAGVDNVEVTGSATQEGGGQQGGDDPSETATIADFDPKIEVDDVAINNYYGQPSSPVVGQEYDVYIQIFGNGANVNNLDVTAENAEVTKIERTYWSETGGQFRVYFKPTGGQVSFAIIAKAASRGLKMAPRRNLLGATPQTVNATVELNHEPVQVETEFVGAPDVTGMGEAIDTRVITKDSKNADGTVSWYYKWSDLPAKDPETGATYHYYVVEEVPDDTQSVTYTRTEGTSGTAVTILNTPVNQPEYGTLTVTKSAINMEAEASEQAIETDRLFTVRLKRTNDDGTTYQWLHWTDADPYSWGAEDGAKTAQFNIHGSATFTGLDDGYTYVVVEDTGTGMVEVDGYVFQSADSTVEVSAAVNVENEKDYTGKLVNKYKPASVDYTVKKVWSALEETVSWPANVESITLTMVRGTESTESGKAGTIGAMDNAFKLTVTVPKPASGNKTAPGTGTLSFARASGNDITKPEDGKLEGITGTVKEVWDENENKIVNYEIYVNGLEPGFIYRVTEESLPGYVTTYQNANGVAKDQSEKDAYNGEQITNTLITYELPSTGGPGTTMFYVLGSILTLLAAVLLITKKRTDGQGIE